VVDDRDKNGELTASCGQQAQADNERTEAALRREKAFTAAALDAQLDTIFLFDPANGEALRWNRAFQETTGYSDEEIARLPALASYYSPEDLERAQTFVSRVLEGDASTIELELICKDGRTIPTEYRVAVIGSEQGTPRLLISVGRDISERLRAEAALRENQRRLTTLMSNLPGMAYRCRNDPDWTMEFISDGCQALTGYLPEQLVGSAKHAYGELIHPEDRQSVWVEVQAAMAQGGPFELTYRIITADGEQKWVWEQGRGVVDADGQLEAIEGLIVDTTQQAQTEQALRQSEAKYRLLFDTADGLFSVVDRSGRIQLMNRKAASFFNGAPEDLVGRSFADLHPGIGPIYTERIKQVIDSGEPVVVEDEVAFPDGSTRWLLSRVNPVPGTETVHLISDDLTARRRMEAQIAQSDRLASMGMLAAGVAHEINNPLSYVLYNLESLSNDLPGLLDDAQLASSPREELLSHLDEALNGTRRIAGIARGLGTFARVEEDRLCPVDLNQVIDAAANMAFNEIKYRGRLVRDHGNVPVVLASDGRLSQVFLNLLVNAAHAIDEGDVDNNEICVRTWVDGEQVCAEVRDTGRGIAPEHLDRLFEPFFSTKGTERNSGLGLAISQSIVEGYGGSIVVESQLGEGTRFTVRLPVGSEEAPQTEATVANPPVREGLEDHGRVLIVDDEPAVRAVMVRMLRSHDTVEAASGVEARRLLEQDQAFDVVVCDMMMPDVSGMDLHHWLAATYPQLAQQLVFVTGGTFTPRARDYLNEVSNIRLEKPINVATFRKTVGDLVRLAKT
jgi:PAS domain S-box-containing protein